MRQFDVFRNPSARSRNRVPYLVVLPTRHLLDLPLTVVGPLLEPRSYEAAERLNPEIEIEDRTVIFSPLEMANIRSRELSNFVTNVEEHRYRILAALDLLFTGA